MSREDQIVQLLTELRDGQRQQLKTQAEALTMQRRQFEMAEQQFERAEKLHSRAETLQNGSAQIIAHARRAMWVVLPLLLVALLLLLWMMFH